MPCIGGLRMPRPAPLRWPRKARRSEWCRSCAVPALPEPASGPGQLFSFGPLGLVRSDESGFVGPVRCRCASARVSVAAVLWGAHPFGQRAVTSLRGAQGRHLAPEHHNPPKPPTYAKSPICIRTATSNLAGGALWGSSGRKWPFCAAMHAVLS